MGERTRDEILSKVAKAFKLSQDKGATEGEAMAAVSAVQKLLARHNLAMADVQDYQQKQSAKDEARGINANWEAIKADITKPRQHFAQFESTLQIAIKHLCNVEPIVFKGFNHETYRKTSRLVLVGEKCDVAIAAALYTELLKTCKHLARERCGKSQWTPSHRSFAEGFTDAVLARARDEKEEAIVDFTATEQQTYALVIRDKTNWLAKAMNELAPNTTRTEVTQRGKIDVDAYHYGKRKGEEIGLGTNGLGQ